MWFDENDIPYVYPNDGRRHIGSGENGDNQVGQVIMSIDKNRWRKIIEVFEIKEAKIKREGDDEDISEHVASLQKMNLKR